MPVPLPRRQCAGLAGLALAALTQANAPAGAAEACVLRYGYTDQNVPPYYLGSGMHMAEPPGASVELVRDIAASAGCTLEPVRLPPARLQISLENGIIDIAGIGNSSPASDKLAYPRDKTGKLDAGRGLQLYTVIFVRAADHLPRDLDTPAYFRGRRLGTFQGASYAAAIRQEGYIVDDGGSDPQRNLDKLLLGRIDGYAVPLASPADMDAQVAGHYHGEVVRLDQPLRRSIIWLVLNKGWYERQPGKAETMWNWMGANGRTRFAQLLKKYEQ
jgi:ABC-type amino acid transport substrate-binding protein